MRYLDMRKQDGHEQTASVIGEHKMRGGLDPKDPESLISSPHKSGRRSTREVRGAQVTSTPDQSALDES